MSEIEDEVDSILKQMGIFESSKLSKQSAQELVTKAMLTFVKGYPRVWWLSLKNSVKRYPCKKNCLEFLPERVATYTETVYYIPETESSEPMPVYELTHEQLFELVEKCSFFEYYVLDTEFKKLLIETEHGQFIETQVTTSN